MHVFVDNNQGYRAWKAEHPEGYIANRERETTIKYLILHRASCRSLDGLTKGASNWTHTYIKVWSATHVELNSYFVSESGILPKECVQCRPRGGTRQQAEPVENLAAGLNDVLDGYFEGNKVLEVHYRRERIHTLVERGVASSAALGQVKCEACGFDFDDCNHRTRGTTLK